MVRTISLEPLTATAFAPFGFVIEATGNPDFMINDGRCGRFHDLARPQVSGHGDSATISVARSQTVTLPLMLDLMERHPLGSQAFIPMNGNRMVVTVAADNNGAPDTLRAFMSNGQQGIQYHRNCWHGVLAPLAFSTAPVVDLVDDPVDDPVVEQADFVIVDRIGEGVNLEEHTLATPCRITG